MAAITCPTCGQPAAFTPPGPCIICGYTEKQTLILSKEDGTVVRVMNLKTRFDQSWANGLFADEAKFWDRKEQFTIEHDGPDWILVAAASTNDTMVNGVRIASSTVLADGDRIAVGKESKGIEKSKIFVSFGSQ
jgi:hypothetical protein